MGMADTGTAADTADTVDIMAEVMEDGATRVSSYPGPVTYNKVSKFFATYRYKPFPWGAATYLRALVSFYWK